MGVWSADLSKGVEVGAILPPARGLICPVSRFLGQGAISLLLVEKMACKRLKYFDSEHFSVDYYYKSVNCFSHTSANSFNLLQ